MEVNMTFYDTDKRDFSNSLGSGIFCHIAHKEYLLFACDGIQCALSHYVLVC